MIPIVLTALIALNVVLDNRAPLFMRMTSIRQDDEIQIDEWQGVPEILVVSHEHHGKKGHYFAVSKYPAQPPPRDAQAQKLRLLDGPIPDLLITQGWIYCLEDAPCVGTNAVTAQATGTKVFLYYYAAVGQPGTPGYEPPGCRVCLPPQRSNESIVVWWKDGKFDLTEGNYVDAEVDDTGHFVTWKTVNATGELVQKPLSDIENVQPHKDTFNEVVVFCSKEKFRL